MKKMKKLAVVLVAFGFVGTTVVGALNYAPEVASAATLQELGVDTSPLDSEIANIDKIVANKELYTEESYNEAQRYLFGDGWYTGSKAALARTDYKDANEANLNIELYAHWLKQIASHLVLKDNSGETTDPGTDPGTGGGETTDPTPTTVPTISYSVHGQKYGWQNAVNNGALAGTVGQAKRLEAVKIGLDTYTNGGLEYRVHMQKLAWSDWVTNGEVAGTTGQARRLEAIQINLTGNLKNEYNVYYRVHMQKKGWSAWANNGEIAGTTGQARRIEALEVRLVKIGDPAPQ